MPLSISNSNFPHHRSPNKNWLLIWGTTLAVAVGIVSGAEVYWRSQGHRPSIVDSPLIWSCHRSQVSNNNLEQVVLLGASRIQLGFSTDDFRERYPDIELTQLAVDGRHPAATLRNLASDERFRGTVICSITEAGFEQSCWDLQQEYVEHYHHHHTFHKRIESVVGSSLQSRLVVLSPQVRFDKVLRSLLAGDPLPKPIYLITRYDRSKLADYSLLDIEAHRRFRIERVLASSNRKPPIPEIWMEDVKKVEEWVQQIASRGGRVVFVRFPTSGEHWVLDISQYPKSEYWDRMAAFTSAETIHFTDVPALTQFELPDTSHLDYRDAPAFTNGLLDELEKRGILPVQ